MRVLVFDVIETLLDLRVLDPAFEAAFDDAGARQQWFSQMLQSAFVATVTGAYRDFGQLGRAALQMTAQRHGIELSQEEQQRILGTIRQLPPHPEVLDGLTRLRDAGFRMAALTNSTAEVAEAQLAHAQVRELFEQALSADMAKRLKPAAEAYHMAAQRLGIQPGDVRMIAAHALGYHRGHTRRLRGSLHRPPWDGPRPSRRAAGHCCRGPPRSCRTDHPSRPRLTPRRRCCRTDTLQGLIGMDAFLPPRMIAGLALGPSAMEPSTGLMTALAG